MRSLNEAVEFGRSNIEQVEDLYVSKGRKEVAEFLGMSYNSVGHALKELGLYNDKIKERIRIRNIDKCKSKNPFLVEDEACSYLLGFILGDGSLHPRKEGNYSVNLYNNDRELMEKLIKLFYDERELSVRHYDTSPDGYSFDTADKGVYLKLIEYGLVPNKSRLGCKLPRVREEMMHHFIRGLFDADGSITSNHRGLKFYIYGHKSYMNELREVFPVPFKDCNRENLDGIAIYDKEGIRSIFNYMYKDASLYIRRKKEVFESCRWIE